MKIVFCAVLVCLFAACASDNNPPSVAEKQKIKALLVDGQNNHKVWPKSTVMLKQYLEESGLFEVDVYRSTLMWRGEDHPVYLALHSDHRHTHVENPVVDPNFAPNFSDYDVVVSNFGYNSGDWPETARRSFEDFMINGGGFVAVHSANNSFPTWDEYNRMVGLSGWGERTEKHGPYIYFTDEGEMIRDMTPGPAGQHGPTHEFQIMKRNAHPIIDGLPDLWLHSRDECYAKLRGPAENMTVITSAYCSLSEGGTGQHEPSMMVIDYGQGRVFNTNLGHDDYSFESVGFITTFIRGAEWAATGAVTFPMPADFPTATESSVRAFVLAE